MTGFAAKTDREEQRSQLQVQVHKGKEKAPKLGIRVRNPLIVQLGSASGPRRPMTDDADWRWNSNWYYYKTRLFFGASLFRIQREL